MKWRDDFSRGGTNQCAASRRSQISQSRSVGAGSRRRGDRGGRTVYHGRRRAGLRNGLSTNLFGSGQQVSSAMNGFHKGQNG